MPHLDHAFLRDAMVGNHIAPISEYRIVVTAVLGLDGDAIARYASRWRDLSHQDRLEVVAAWSAAMSAENRWHNSYSPMLDGVAYEEWFRAVETFEAVCARMERLGASLPTDRVDAFMSGLDALARAGVWPSDRLAAFATSLDGAPDAYGALVALVSAALLSDTRDPPPAAVHALPFGWPKAVIQVTPTQLARSSGAVPSSSRRTGLSRLLLVIPAAWARWSGRAIDPEGRRGSE
jgi:hypothetical protein